MFKQADLERFSGWCFSVARVARATATLMALLVVAAMCVNLRAPVAATGRPAGKAPPMRVDGVLVSSPGEAPVLIPARPSITGPDSAYFREHPLMVPVEGFPAVRLADSFHERRSGGRIHQATDILSPRGTPVLATTDGRIIKLATGGAGGITMYVVDTDGRYIHYYAHLDGYAPEVREGLDVKEGELIGFVGTTGNAPPNTPHLHYQVMRRDRDWWNGTPVDVRPFMIKPARRR